MNNKQPGKPVVQTVLSPALLNLYELNSSIVVIIDVLRATSTIATALHHGAKEIIPVATVAECIQLGKQMDAITAGERDGKIAEGLQYGNTPSVYTPKFVGGKTVVLTTTNGTRLLHQALEADAEEIITGAFCNLSSVCQYLVQRQKNVLLACAAWRNRVNLEDTLFAGAVIDQIKDQFEIKGDSSQIAEILYQEARPGLFEYMKNKKASHYQRLMDQGLEADIRYCLSVNSADTLPVYENGRLAVRK